MELLTRKHVGGSIQGLALKPFNIKNVIGVANAYTTRVGGGPLPTEQDGDVGQTLQEFGEEIAVSAGRRRRCGCKQHFRNYRPLNNLRFELRDMLQELGLLCTS